MAQTTILIYDGNQGQFQAGLGPIDKFSDWKRESLLSEDPDAASKILSLDEIFNGLDVTWKEAASYEECTGVIQDAQILVIYRGRVDQPLLERANQLKEVHALGFFSSEIDRELLRNRGIKYYCYPITNALAVAEHTLALLLVLVKRLQEADQAVREGTSWMTIPGNVRVLQDLTIGILGTGEIGYHVARLLKPWGCRILYHDLRRMPELEEETGAQFIDRQSLFEKSDVVSVHMSLNPLSLSSISIREFDWMQPHALFINTARAEIINERALTYALQSGSIGGAALDVFAMEPLSVDHPLTRLPNVILTPHMAWAGPWTLVNDARRVFTGVTESVRKMSML